MTPWCAARTRILAEAELDWRAGVTLQDGIERTIGGS